MNRDNINYNHFHNPNLIKFLFPTLNFEVEDFDNNLIKKNSLNLEIKHKIASKLFKEIFLGLKYIHSHNIIHRDIKIENLLFDSKENKIKIIDFSISTILFSKNNKIDEPGGSMHYQAPELQNIETNTNYNPFYADIWSVGICLYIFIFEEFPFDSDSELELQIKILENDIKLPFNPLNKFYENLLFQLLEKNPEKRLTDINKIIDSDYFKIS
jgi:serine/threonine protein kinase